MQKNKSTISIFFCFASFDIYGDVLGWQKEKYTNLTASGEIFGIMLNILLHSKVEIGKLSSDFSSYWGWKGGIYGNMIEVKVSLFSFEFKFSSMEIETCEGKMEEKSGKCRSEKFGIEN
jgi:hypothetical protein